METCVLIPPEFSLVLTPDPTTKVFEMGVSVWTTKSLNPGQNFYPDQGIVKIDKLDVYGLLQDDDVRIKFGCIDEIKTTENGKLRHCNWVRFLQPCSDLDKVNLVAVKVNGRPVFQVVKAVEANTQLLAYFDDEERGGMPVEIREALRESFGEEEKCQSENEKNDEIDIEPISPASVDKTSDIASDDLNMDSDSEIIDVVDGDCSPAPTEQKSRTPELHQENPKYGMLGNQIPGFYPHNPHVAAYFQSMLMAQEAARIKQASPRSLSPGEIPKNSPNSSFRQSPSPGYQNPYLPPYFFGQPPAGSSSPNQNLHSPTYVPGKDGPMPQLVKPNAIHLSSGQNMMRFVPTPWGVTSPDLAMRQTVISPISYNYPSPNKTLSPMAIGAKNVKMPADKIEEVAKSLEGAAGSEESHNTSKSSTSSVGKDTSTGSSPGKTPVKRNRERTWLPCEVCGKKFDRPSLLRRHMRTHTGEKPHACDVCGKAFSTSSSLNTHRRIHSGEKPHQCRVCGKRFTASSNLYYHRMTHNKEKPHKCTLCSKSFPTPGDLKSHMYVHNGSWPFRCDICDRGFSKQTNLKNHLLLHSGDKPHECQLCGKRFALQCNLRTHQKTHEGEPQEECFKCGKLFLSQLQRLVNGYCKNCLNSSIGGANAGGKKSGQKQESAKPFKSITDFLKPDSETKNPNATADIRHVLPTSFRYPLHLAPSSDVQSYANALLPSRVPPMAHSGAPMVPHDLSASYAAHFRQYTQIPSAVPIAGEVYPHRPIGISAKTLQSMVNSGNGMVHYGPGTSWPRVVGSPF